MIHFAAMIANSSTFTNNNAMLFMITVKGPMMLASNTCAMLLAISMI